MPETAWLADFHFLRPAWLWLLAAAAAVPVAAAWREHYALPGAREIAPHLLKYLTVPRGRTWWLRPAHLVGLVLALGTVALAGPAWEREPTPFTEDLAPLVILLDLSTTMNAIDVAPTRLERAKQKIRNLLALRSGARTALVVYAGTAHLVLPPTDDPDVVALYLDALSTDLMPREGKNPSAALAIASDILGNDEVPGSVLLIADGVPRQSVPDFVRLSAGDSAVMALGVGTSEGGPIRVGENRFLQEGGRRVIARLDREEFETLAREAGAYVGTVTVDDTDVTRLQRRVQSHLRAVREEDASARWKDAGYYLVYPVAVLALLWFRRGWTVNWSAVGLLLLLLWPLPAHAQSAPGGSGFRVIDLWMSRNQQGRYHFERGEYDEAARRFTDPFWKGTACYRAGDLPCAVDQFARVDSAEANFNLGNAYVRLKQWEDAVGAYDRALQLAPELERAQENRALVLDVIRRIEETRKKAEEEEQGQADPTLEPDEVKFDGKGDKGKMGQIDRALVQEAMTEAWLRGLQTTPADFLRMKFSIQAEGSRPAGDGGRRTDAAARGGPPR